MLSFFIELALKNKKQLSQVFQHFCKIVQYRKRNAENSRIMPIKDAKDGISFQKASQPELERRL